MPPGHHVCSCSCVAHSSFSLSLRAGRCPPAGGCGGGAAGHQRERQPGVFLRHGLLPMPPTDSAAPLQGSLIALLHMLLLAAGAPGLRAASSVTCKPHTASLALEGGKQQRSMLYILNLTRAWCTGSARPPQPTLEDCPGLLCKTLEGQLLVPSVLAGVQRPQAAEGDGSQAVGGRSCGRSAPMAYPCSRAQASSGRSLLQRELLGEKKGHYGHAKPFKHEHKGHYGALLPACLQAFGKRGPIVPSCTHSHVTNLVTNCLVLACS